MYNSKKTIELVVRLDVIILIMYIDADELMLCTKIHTVSMSGFKKPLTI